MIDSPDTAIANVPTFDQRLPDILVEPPAGNLCMPSTPIAISQKVENFEITPIDSGSQQEGNEKSEALLEEIAATARREVERYPDSPRTHTNLGLALLQCRQLEEAVNEFQVALKLDPSLYLPAAGLARVSILQKRLDEAEEIYRHLRNTRPADPNPLMSLADLAVRRGEFGTAVKLWKQVVDLKPGDAFARFFLGMSLFALHRRTEAIAHLRTATRMKPRSATLHYGLGVVYTYIPDYRQAVKAFTAALTLAPRMTPAIHGLAEVLLKQEQVQKVIQLLNEYLQYKPTDYLGRELLASAYIQLKDYKKVRSELFQALNLVPNSGEQAALHQARLSNNLGICCRLQGSTDEALKLFRRSIQAKPDLGVDAYHNLAQLLIEKQAIGEAHQIINACARQFPGDQETLVFLAFLLKKEKRYEQAITILLQLVQTGKAPLSAYHQLGDVLIDGKPDFSAAIRVLDEARRRFPDDIRTINNLAYAHLMRGDPAAARAVLALAPQNLSDDLELILPATWGLVYLWEDDFEKGKQGYERAEQIALRQGKSYWIPQIRQKMHLELARAYWRIGDQKAARREVKSGLSKRGRDSYHRDLQLLDRTLQKSGE